MIKRLPSLALALLMTFSFLPFSALADNLQTITSVSIDENGNRLDKKMYVRQEEKKREIGMK